MRGGRAGTWVICLILGMLHDFLLYLFCPPPHTHTKDSIFSTTLGTAEKEVNCRTTIAKTLSHLISHHTSHTVGNCTPHSTALPSEPLEHTDLPENSNISTEPSLGALATTQQQFKQCPHPFQNPSTSSTQNKARWGLPHLSINAESRLRK